MCTCLAFWKSPLFAVALAFVLGCFSAGASEARAQTARQDPPREVGRLALIDGTVSYHTADETHWRAAQRNYPVTTGQSFWTEPKAHAGIQLAGNEIYLDSSTELDVSNLNEQAIQLSLPQGATFVDLRSPVEGQNYQIDIARAAVRLTSGGRYEIVAGDTEHDSQITVLEGSAHVAGSGVDFDLPAGKTALLSGEQTIAQQIEQEGAPDAFMTWVETQERHRPGTLPKVASRMTGASDLAAYGRWTRTERYGEVWYPNVSAGWAPYREGYWSWVAPWGWTWIDDEEWGFAPFHYGRWCLIDNEWAWVPIDETVAQEVMPIYAPALVIFFEVPQTIAWVPLGPDEAYVPTYPVSQNYFQQINSVYVGNVAQITKLTSNRTKMNQYANARALTAIPQRAMTDSRPIASTALPVSAARFANAKPVLHRDPARPTALTAGLSPAVARRFGIRHASATTSRAPGPPIQQVQRNPNARLSSRPALAQAAPKAQMPTTAPRPAAPRSGEASQRPALALPGDMHHLPGSPVSPAAPSAETRAGAGATATASRPAPRTTTGLARSPVAAPSAAHQVARPQIAAPPRSATVGQARSREVAAPPRLRHAAPPRMAGSRPRPAIGRAPPRIAAPAPPHHAAPPQVATHRPAPPVGRAPQRVAAPPPHAVPPQARAAFGQAPPQRAPAPVPHAAPAAQPPHAAGPAPQGRPHGHR